MEQYIFGQIRLQVLNNNVVRAEQSVNGKFFDEDSFLIPNRNEPVSYTHLAATTRTVLKRLSTNLTESITGK